MSTRVAILKGHLAPGGGLEKWTRRLATAFSDKGCEVTILTTGTAEIKLDGIEIVSLGPRSKWSLRQLWQFDRCCKQWLKGHPSDIVFGLDRNSWQTHYRAGNGVHAEYLRQRSVGASPWKRLSFRLNPQHRQILRFEKAAFESPDLRTLFTNSRMVQREILEHYKVSGSKIHVVHNGAEWQEMAQDFLQWPERKEDIRKSLDLSPKSFQFLFVGSGFERKGLPQLMKGLARLSYLDFQLSVVGKDRELAKFQAMAQELGLEKQIFFFGPQAQVRPFYQMADALLIPSTYDPFANVTVEALAMGLFVVSSLHNGGHEVLTPETGTVIEDLEDRASMVQALERALSRSKTPASALAIRESVKDLDIKRQLDKIVLTSLSTAGVVPNHGKN